ncbi:MAG: hypothetical protein DRP87_18630, partial [Spirochaetes bacterium]
MRDMLFYPGNTNSEKKIAKTLFTTLFLLIAGLPLFVQELPRPEGWVNDYAGVIMPEDREKINAIIKAVEEKTGAEIAIAAVESMEPYPTIEDFSIELASKWGIGKEGEDNGVLIVLALKERKVRIEVGYGLEGAIPDGLAGEIMDKSIIPHFRTGDYSTGFLKGVEAIAGIIAKEYNVELGELSLKESERYTR